MGTHLFDLAPHDRLKRLRELACEAKSTVAREGMNEYWYMFLRIAARWEMMADELEKAISEGRAG